MRFLLCTTFWLGLVFAHMDWGGDAARPTADARAAAASAAEGARNLCTMHARACLDAAAHAGAIAALAPAKRG